MYKLNQTADQLVGEFFRDLPNIFEECDKVKLTKEYKQLRRTGARYPRKITRQFKTIRGNRYVVNHIYNTRADVFSKHNTDNVTAILPYPDGRYGAIAFNRNVRTDDTVALEFVPHFFEQYAERTNCLKRGVPLIAEFFSRNRYCTPAPGFERPGDQTAEMWTVSDGAIFGHSEGEKHLCLTFINSAYMSRYKGAFNAKHDEETESYLKFLQDKPYYLKTIQLRKDGNQEN